MNNQGTTSNNNEITQEESGQLNTHERELMGQLRRAQRALVPPPPPPPPPRNTLLASSGTTSNNIEITEDHVTVFVAYNGEWEYDRKEWSFENSKSSIMVVPKHVTLSEITEILHKQLKVNIEDYRLKLEVHYRTGSPWFPVTEIKNDQDLSVFISENSKTKLPLCVTRLNYFAFRIYDDEISSDVAEERRKDDVRVLVAYNGKWRWDGEKWLFENSEGSIMDVFKNVTLSEITDMLYEEFYVDPRSYDLKLEVHYRDGSPWFPVTEIQNDQDLSLFISEAWKTKLPLCVTRVAKVVALRERVRKDDEVEKRLYKAIQKGNWMKARQIVNAGEITWTTPLVNDGYTALHFAVGEFANIEAAKDILRGLNPESLVTIKGFLGEIPTHTAAKYGNTEALKIMLEYFNMKYLFVPNVIGDLAIHYSLIFPSIKTFRYLFKQMKSYKVEYNTLCSGMSGLNLLHQVIDAGLIIDVAYELINDYPSLATTVYKGKTALERIIRKPELFYSGTSYSFYSRFVYHIVPVENNSLDSTDTADVENQETPKKDNSVTKHTRRCFHDVIWKICFKLWETTLLHVPHVKHLKDDKVKHNITIKLLRRICEETDRTYTESDIERLYSSPFCLAVENNTPEVVDMLTTYFAGLLYNSEKDGRNIYQLTVLNRSEKVFRYIVRFAKFGFSVSLDDDDNNILHLAGHLAPVHKLIGASGAALQMQRELQWFEEVTKVVGIEHRRALNKNKETPMMVFRREHMELRKDGEEWIKRTADSYTVTAALIIAICFAAAITVPGGNDSATGRPINETKASLIIFAISEAVSLFTSTTSLLFFLSVITARYADEDFLYRLPNRLFIQGLVMLFVSLTSMMIAFSAALYIMFGQGKTWILIPIAALACLPIVPVVVQFPMLVEIISSTYGHGIFGNENDYRQSSANANKNKRT